METSCVLCLALSLQIYIKQRSTANVSLQLCCACHLSICLPACQPLSLSGVYQALQLISSLFPTVIPSYFRFCINLGKTVWVVYVCASLCQLSFSNVSMVAAIWGNSPQDLICTTIALITQITFTLHFSESSCLTYLSTPLPPVSPQFLM